MEVKELLARRAGPAASPRLAGARVLVAYGSGLAPGLAVALAETGARSVRLLGDRPLARPDLDSCSRLEAADLGRPASAAVARLGREVAPDFAVEGVPAWPASQADWEASVSGASMLVACVGGPILFYGWVRQLNQAAVRARLPLLAAYVPTAGEIQLGPAAFPGRTACYHCYALRLKSNLNDASDLEALERHFAGEREAPAHGIPLPLWDLAASLMARQVVAAIQDPEGCPTRGKLMLVDGHTYAMSLHPVLRLPRCPVCATAFEPAPGE